MDRATLTAQLAQRFEPILSAAGLTGDDTASGLKPALDATFVAIDSRTPNGQEPVDWPLPLARYYTLDLVLDRLQGSHDLSDSGTTLNFNQLTKNVEKRLAQAKADVAWFMTPPAPTINPDSYGSGPITWQGRT